MPILTGCLSQFDFEKGLLVDAGTQTNGVFSSVKGCQTALEGCSVARQTVGGASVVESGCQTSCEVDAVSKRGSVSRETSTGEAGMPLRDLRPELQDFVRDRSSRCENVSDASSVVSDSSLARETVSQSVGLESGAISELVQPAVDSVSDQRVGVSAENGGRKETPFLDLAFGHWLPEILAMLDDPSQDPSEV